jgi:hypothetical protein
MLLNGLLPSAAAFSEWCVIRPEPSCCIFLSQNSLRFSSGKGIYRQQSTEAVSMISCLRYSNTSTQRKFSTSIKSLPTRSICVYRIQRLSGETASAVLPVSMVVSFGNTRRRLIRLSAKL